MVQTILEHKAITVTSEDIHYGQLVKTRPVVLVSLDWLRPGDPPFGLGIASIAASLRASHVDFQIIYDAINRRGFSDEDFLKRVKDAVRNAGSNVLVGIGSFVWCEYEVQKLLQALCQKVDVVLGGPQISYTGKNELEALYPGAQYFVRGYGELAMTSLATGMARNGQHGLHVAGEVDLCSLADFPLVNLPSPHLDGTSPIGNFVRWETRRGCQFACSFCQHKQSGGRLRNSDFGSGRLQHEMFAFCKAKTKRINVLDPIFNNSGERAVGLLRYIDEMDIKAHFSFQCRFELVNESFLDAVENLDATLEFGLQTVHEDEARAVDRPNHMKKIERIITELNNRGIPYEVSLIYGLPFQTVKRFEESIKWCKEHGVRKVRAWPLMLLRGTKIHAEQVKWGYVESTGERIPVVVESQWFSRNDYSKMNSIADGLK